MEGLKWQWSATLNDYYSCNPNTGGYFAFDQGRCRPIQPPNAWVKSTQGRSAPSGRGSNYRDISAAASSRSQTPNSQASIESPGRFGIPVSLRDQSDYQQATTISQRPQATSGSVSTVIHTYPQPDPITDPVLLRQGIRAHGTLYGTGNDEHERLDPDFKLRKRDFFSVGRVFLVLWSEPAGGNKNASTITRGSDYNTGLYGEPVHSKVRRFVVIREGENYCSALPITTYGYQGVSKRGTKKSEHAVVYTGRVAPAPLADEAPSRGEQPMLSRPIRVVPDDKSDALEPHSRLDFGKVHTVHHNIKAKAFGMVHRDSLNPLIMHFRQVWIDPVSNQPASKSQAGEESSSEEDGPDKRVTSSQRKGKAPAPPASSRKAHVRQDVQRDDSDDNEEDEEGGKWDARREVLRRAQLRLKSKAQDRETLPTAPSDRNFTARRRLGQADSTEDEDESSDDDEDEPGYLVA